MAIFIFILSVWFGLRKVFLLYVFLYFVISGFLFITFGGFSIHTKVKCIVEEYGLDYKYFFKGRILQLIIAIILTFIP